MRIFITLFMTLAASPALAASGPFFSLRNTNFVVLIAFLIFIGVLIYFKVPAMLTGLLDKRANEIKAELEEARRLREEAQSVLASYERKQKEVAGHAERIVEHAKEEAQLAANQAKEDLKVSIERRLAAAEDQIKSAEAAALREVRDQAVAVAVGAASDVIAKKMTAAEGNELIDESIAKVEKHLH